MNKVIYKYRIHPGITILQIPAGGQVLSVQEQNEEPHIWVLVDPNERKTDRKFQIFGTGQQFYAADKKYIGTFQLMGGESVFHLYEHLHS